MQTIQNEKAWDLFEDDFKGAVMQLNGETGWKLALGELQVGAIDENLSKEKVVSMSKMSAMQQDTVPSIRE